MWLIDLNAMPAIDDVHREFGSASETAQLLETEIGTLLFQLRGENLGYLDGEHAIEAGEILDRINRSTLGRLINTLKAETNEFDAAAPALASALAERNRLAHHFYRQHNFRRNSEDGRVVMVADLEKIHSAILTAYQLVLKLVGLDLATIQITPTQHLPLG